MKLEVKACHRLFSQEYFGIFHPMSVKVCQITLDLIDDGTLSIELRFAYAFLFRKGEVFVLVVFSFSPTLKQKASDWKVVQTSRIKYFAQQGLLPLY